MRGPPEETSLPADEQMLELLAEVESLRRKARLLDARLQRWEARLDEACAAVDGLLAAVEPDRDPERRLADLEARVERLVRRRAVAAPTAAMGGAPQPGRPAPPAAPPGLDAVAIVNARWLVDGAPPDGPVAGRREVELVADVDGIPAEAAVVVEVRPIGSSTAEATLEATSDGDHIRARWRLPAESPDRAWCFTARVGDAESTSAPIYLA